MPKPKAFETIIVTRTIHAPIAEVFALLSNHPGYTAFKGIKDAYLLQEGKDEPNGLGAVRRIDLGSVWFEEAITAFEPPVRMDYQILRSRPPIDHQLGSITLQATDQGTEITWKSVFRVRIPLIGAWLTRSAARTGERAFGRILRDIERTLIGES